MMMMNKRCDGDERADGGDNDGVDDVECRIRSIALNCRFYSCFVVVNILHKQRAILMGNEKRFAAFYVPTENFVFRL